MKQTLASNNMISQTWKLLCLPSYEGFLQEPTIRKDWFAFRRHDRSKLSLGISLVSLKLECKL